VLPAVAFLVAAAIATAIGAATGYPHTRWLALHLLLVGGVSGLILGAAPFFTGAFLATGPSSRAVRRTQLTAWNAGAVLLPIGVLGRHAVVAGAGGALLLAGLAAFALALRTQMRRSLRRHAWPAYWYLTASILLAVGIVVGELITRGAAGFASDPVAAHRTLNLAGWVGGAIVGTLHTLYPALTRTRLAHPALERTTYAAWLAGVVITAAGYGAGAAGVTLLGYLLLLGAAGQLTVNIVAALRRAPRIALPAQLVGVGHAMLLAGLLVAVASAVQPASTLELRAQDALLELLVAGWIGLTVLGALSHLLGTISRSPASRHQTRRATDAPLTALVAAGLVAVTASELLGGTPVDLAARVAVGVAYACLVTHVLRLAVCAVRTRRPAI
jgi:nitrite reductase (NO-forming)